FLFSTLTSTELSSPTSYSLPSILTVAVEPALGVKVAFNSLSGTKIPVPIVKLLAHGRKLTPKYGLLKSASYFISPLKLPQPSPRALPQLIHESLASRSLVPSSLKPFQPAVSSVVSLTPQAMLAPD